MARRGYHASVNVHQAKSTLSKLLARVEAGEEIVVCRNGTPIARLIAEPDAEPVRRPGRARGMLAVAPGFERGR